MSIAYEFFKENEVNPGNMEDKIIFFIDHYSDFLYYYRVISIQHAATKAKKEKAHQDLQEHRERIEKIKKSGRELNENEKLSLQERTEYLEALREEDDTIYFRGEPMEFNQVTRILINYQKMFKYIEIIDHVGRTKIASAAKSMQSP